MAEAIQHQRATIPVHEAGHAVLHIMLGLGCEHVTIVPDEDSAGATFHEGELAEESEDMRAVAEEEFLLRHAAALYAGAEAVRQLGAKHWRVGADNDYYHATDAINRISGDPKAVDLLFKLAKRRSFLLVKHYWPEITALANQLEKARTLTGDQAREIVFDSLKQRGAGIATW